MTSKIKKNFYHNTNMYLEKTTFRDLVELSLHKMEQVSQLGHPLGLEAINHEDFS